MHNEATVRAVDKRVLCVFPDHDLRLGLATHVRHISLCLVAEQVMQCRTCIDRAVSVYGPGQRA